MEKDEFISGLIDMIPGCTQEMVEVWSSLANERVEMEQYVDFNENPDGNEVEVENWLETIYTGLGLIKQRFNLKIALQIVKLSAVPFCLFPYEMYAAAQHFSNGGKPEDIPKLNEEGLLESVDTDNWPKFPKLDMLKIKNGVW